MFDNGSNDYGVLGSSNKYTENDINLRPLSLEPVWPECLSKENFP